MHKEIGGYLEMERFNGPMMHEDALALSSGRACLSYLIEQRDIRKLLLPDLLCDAVTKVCEERGVGVRRYQIGEDLRPEGAEPEEDEWLYLVNYYGQLTKEELLSRAKENPRLIVDNAQAYFSAPVPGADTLYTCRKFLGVADGGFLYTDAPRRALERDESHGRMGFVLGRFERPAGEFFAEAAANNDSLPTKARAMSELTKNLLRGVDYYAVRDRRTGNYRMLHEAFQDLNLLTVRKIAGAYAYPHKLPCRLLVLTVGGNSKGIADLCKHASVSVLRRIAHEGTRRISEAGHVGLSIFKAVEIALFQKLDSPHDSCVRIHIGQ